MIADKFDQYLKSVPHPPELMTPNGMRVLKMAFMAGAIEGAMKTENDGSAIGVVAEVASFSNEMVRENNQRN